MLTSIMRNNKNAHVAKNIPTKVQIDEKELLDVIKVQTNEKRIGNLDQLLITVQVVVIDHSYT